MLYFPSLERALCCFPYRLKHLWPLKRSQSWRTCLMLGYHKFCSEIDCPLLNILDKFLVMIHVYGVHGVNIIHKMRDLQNHPSCLHILQFFLYSWNYWQSGLATFCSVRNHLSYNFSFTINISEVGCHFAVQGHHLSLFSVLTLFSVGWLTQSLAVSAYTALRATITKFVAKRLNYKVIDTFCAQLTVSKPDVFAKKL